jgi:hypothetical protein
MKDPAVVLSVGAIILALMGSIAGTFFIGIIHRFKKRGTLLDKSDIPDAIILVAFAIFLICVIGTMGYLLLFGNVVSNQNVFFTVIGILFGIVGSMLANSLVIHWDSHHETKIRDGKWLNREGWLMVGEVIILAVYIAYLLALFFQFD